LARKDARTLAIVGTGVQARSHARVVAGVRDFAEILVGGRDAGRARALADELGPSARAADSIEAACRAADVICATTHAAEPVLRREWLTPGTHVNSVGFDPEGREVDDATVADALLVVESRAAALAPPPSGSPDLAGLDAGDVAEIGELVLGTRPGRTAADQITLYKSVGVAVQDAAAAALVLRAARERGIGREVEL
jgi:ornithine cyclodeaminase